MLQWNSNLEIVAPTGDALQIGPLLKHLRAQDWERDEVSAYMAAAEDYIEAVTGRQLRRSTWIVNYPWFYRAPFFYRALHRFNYPYLGAWEMLLPTYPAIRVASVTYYDEAGNLTTLDPSQYQTGTRGNWTVIAPARETFWPITDLNIVDAVSITYEAGADTISPRAAQAIRLLTGHYYAFRQSVLGGAVVEIPIGLRALIRSLGNTGVS
jgi:hypothetical protein